MVLRSVVKYNYRIYFYFNQYFFKRKGGMTYEKSTKALVVSFLIIAAFVIVPSELPGLYAELPGLYK